MQERTEDPKLQCYELGVRHSEAGVHGQYGAQRGVSYEVRVRKQRPKPCPRRRSGGARGGGGWRRRVAGAAGCPGARAVDDRLRLRVVFPSAWRCCPTEKYHLAARLYYKLCILLYSLVIQIIMYKSEEGTALQCYVGSIQRASGRWRRPGWPRRAVGPR